LPNIDTRDHVQLEGPDGAAGREGPRGNDFVRSLERGLAVIKAFDAHSTSLTLSDVSRRTGLTRAAARRFLLTLAELGYVHHDGRAFSLRPSVLDLGFAYLSSMGLPEVALPHMERLVADVQESSSMSVLDGTDVIYVARVPTRHRIMAVSIAVGTRFPAYATSMGRVLMAGMDDDELAAFIAANELRSMTAATIHDTSALRAEVDKVRERGYAIIDQELEDGLRSAAAPVRSETGATVAAINVSVHASRATVEQIRDHIVPKLLRTVAEVSADLASVGNAATHGR